MPIFCRAAAILTAIVALCPSLQGGDASKDDLKRLQGAWNLIEFSINGNKSSSSGVWTISGSKISYRDKSKWTIFSINAIPEPKWFDYEEHSKDGVKKGIGIYEVNGDTLRVWTTVSRDGKEQGVERPKSFEQKEGHVGFVLQRVKKGK